MITLSDRVFIYLFIQKSQHIFIPLTNHIPALAKEYESYHRVLGVPPQHW